MSSVLSNKTGIRVIIIGLLISCTYGLQLEGLSTKKPRITKYNRSSVPNALITSTTPKPSTVSIFRAENEGGGAACIVIEADALLSIEYMNQLGEKVEADLFVPDESKVEGDCRDLDSQLIKITFKGFVLTMNFAKTPGGERWYVDSILLEYDSKNPLLAHVQAPKNSKVILGTGNKRALLFTTPVGKSFICDRETAVVLNNVDEDSTIDQRATLYLRELRLQAFMYKEGGIMGPPFKCSATGVRRDETAAVAVGATLAIAVLVTLAGYAGFRYIKVKKVQYDTME